MASFSTIPELDVELLKKYDRAGPRYTSYPTAPAFHEGFQSEDFRQALTGNKPLPFGGTNRNLSLYFHIPFCDTLCYFCGCNMIVSNNRSRINHYLQYLIREIGLNRSHIADNRKLEQLHWGGGTPTHLNPEEIRTLGKAIASNYDFADDFEASCEIDPRELTREHLEALHESGFNRISLGLQDLNPQVQKAVNRIQSLELTAGIVKQARELGFKSINIDLIYGLPRQTPGSFAATLEQVLEMDPDRIALFNFAYLPKMFKHHKVIISEEMPGPADKLEILVRSVQRICTRGYRFIGMDHFAKEGDELALAQDRGDLYRNFQGYTTGGELDLLGIGPTAISQFPHLFSQNERSLKAYGKALSQGRLPVERGLEVVDSDVLERRALIRQVMCQFALSLDLQRFSEEWSLLQELESDGLVRLSVQQGQGQMEVTTEGRWLIRTIAAVFDPQQRQCSSGSRLI